MVSFSWSITALIPGELFRIAVSRTIRDIRSADARPGSRPQGPWNGEKIGGNAYVHNHSLPLSLRKDSQRPGAVNDSVLVGDHWSVNAYQSYRPRPQSANPRRGRAKLRGADRHDLADSDRFTCP